MISAPEHWLRAPLERVGVWRGGGTPAKSHTAYWSHGTVPWVSPKDIKQTYIDTAANKITPRAVEEAGLQIIPAGSILIVARSGILARTLPVAITTVPVVVNQDVKALTPAPEVDALFLYQQLSYLENDLLQRTVKPGTTVQSVDFQALKRIEVVLPPLVEQRAIAERLAIIGMSLDSARAQLRSVLGLLDAYRHALLMEALSGHFTSAVQHLGEPTSVREVKLGEIADIQGGLALGKRYGTAEVVTRPYLRVANVQRGWLDLDDVREVLVTPAEAERHKLIAGDILMNEGGDRDKLGRGWVWRGEIPDCLHQNHVFRVRLKDPKFPPEFVSLYANELGREYFLSKAKQTTNLASISKTRLSALPIRLPSAEQARAALRAYEEQTRWTDGVRYQAQSAIAATDAAQRSANRKAFAGQLVPKALYEPALSLSMLDAQLHPGRAVRQRRSSAEKGSTMSTLSEMLDRWPDEGITFEALRDQVPSDYESLKDSIFDLLAGAAPKLEQRYDSQDQAMRFFRRIA